MSVNIYPALGTPLSSLLSLTNGGSLDDKQLELIQWCQMMSGEMWTAWIGGDLVAIWGLIPPSLLSSQAYLWMHSTDAVREHTFLFVRHSQRMVERMLKHYEIIIGHCEVEAAHSRRWLRWLGAEFGSPSGPFVPFTIRRPYG